MPSGAAAFLGEAKLTRRDADSADGAQSTMKSVAPVLVEERCALALSDTS